MLVLTVSCTRNFDWRRFQYWKTSLNITISPQCLKHPNWLTLPSNLAHNWSYRYVLNWSYSRSFLYIFDSPNKFGIHPATKTTFITKVSRPRASASASPCVGVEPWDSWAWKPEGWWASHRCGVCFTASWGFVGWDVPWKTSEVSWHMTYIYIYHVLLKTGRFSVLHGAAPLQFEGPIRWMVFEVYTLHPSSFMKYLSIPWCWNRMATDIISQGETVVSSFAG